MSTSGEPLPWDRAPVLQRLHLTLFISGASPASARAVRRLRALCDLHASSGYDLEIVDIYQQPEVVFSRGVLALPTLIKEQPLPVQVLIGDFTDEARVLSVLGLSAAKDG